jgi:hypothetical protein
MKGMYTFRDLTFVLMSPGLLANKFKFRMPSSGTLCHVAVVRTDVSEEFSAFIIRVTRIGELGTLAITSNRCNSL